MFISVFSHLSWVFLLVTLFIDFLLSSYYCFIDVVILGHETSVSCICCKELLWDCQRVLMWGWNAGGPGPTEIHTPQAKTSDSTHSIRFS